MSDWSYYSLSFLFINLNLFLDAILRLIFTFTVIVQLVLWTY